MASAQSNMNMTRAERFEDERRRIIESCFAKVDTTTGVLAESYIIHIRVQEDAAFPQSPPPPDSPQDNKKPRIIVVAVRNSGRVRMHKGRENSNGTFSIGKTWNLDDLSKIQSYSFLEPRTNEDAQFKTWAGDRGFLVTLVKPYYWQAATSKEKDFFIQSLVKIFRKYTSGRVPELLGFSSQEIDGLIGGVGQRPPTAAPAPLSPPRARGLSGSRSPEPSSRDPRLGAPSPGSRVTTAQSDRSVPMGRMPSSGQLISPPIPPAVEALRQPRMAPSPDRSLRQVPSREQSYDRPIAPSMDSQRLTPQSSRSEMNQLRPESAGTSASSSMRPNDDSPPRQRVESFEEENGPSNGLGISSAQFKTNGMNRTASPFGQRQQKQPSFSSTSSLRAAESSADEGSVDQSVVKKPVPISKRAPGYGTRTANESSAPQASKLSESTNGNGLIPSMPGAFIPSPEANEKVERNGLYPSPPVRRTPSPMTAEAGAENGATSPDTLDGAAERSVTPLSEPEEHRPGLGPMVKKSGKLNAAATFRKAAMAANAFKPRAGGAGEKLRLLKEQGIKVNDEADGITGVFRAPGLQKKDQPSDAPKSPISPISPVAPTPPRLSEETSKLSLEMKRDVVPEVNVISPVSTSPSPQVSAPIAQLPVRPPSPQEIAVESEEVQKARKRKRRSDQQIKYLSALGIETTILDGRGLEFESLLGDFGWGGETHNKKVELMESEVKKELGRVEAGSWLMSGAGERDERVDQVEKMLDRAIRECEELDTLLTLYSVELSSLNDDISFIEAQSQGLQVQTANQKLLQAELQTLVETISITPEQLEPLRRGAIGSKNGLREIEDALVVLFKAMITIDPTIRQGVSSNSSDSQPYGSNELASMRALQEKRDNYMSESTVFLDRLKQFMDMTFGAALMDAKDGMEKARSMGKLGTKLDVQIHDQARSTLWQYSPLMLFAKEVDTFSWDGFLKMYQVRARPIFQEELRENMGAWKKNARKPTGDEAELLFSTQEKETEGISSTARKLTVKRSQTLARTLRSAGSDKAEREKQSGKLFPFEVFAGALDEMKPILFTEQNFIVEFFHATSSESVDFVDAIVSTPPNRRSAPNLDARKLFEPDRAMAKKVAEVMEDIFATWPNDLQNMVEWAVRSDPLQGVGVLGTLDRHLAMLEETNQDFLTRTLLAIQTRLSGLFTRFVDEQVRAIEDTKVKIKKRRGVIAFIKVFPAFSAAIENMLPRHDAHEHQERNETRVMVDEAYGKVNKAMFESLKVIAKESPGVVGAGADPEDKEALNYHILLIENMNHYVEEVDERGDPILAEWRASAQAEGEEHLALYVDAVIRRPLGRIIDFLEQTESPASGAARSTATSAPALKKLLGSHDNKELRRGIEALRKRVEKHFGDADDPGLSRNLVLRVLKACEAKYEETVARINRVQAEQYVAEETGEWWKPEDVAVAFRR